MALRMQETSAAIPDGPGVHRNRAKSLRFELQKCFPSARGGLRAAAYA